MAKKIMWIDLDACAISICNPPDFLSQALIDEAINGKYDAFGVITHRGSLNNVLSILQYEENIQPYALLAGVFTSTVIENFSRKTKLKCIGVSMMGDIAKFSLQTKTATREELASFRIPTDFSEYFGREYEQTIKPFEDAVLYNRGERQRLFDRGADKNGFTLKIKRFDFDLEMNIVPEMQYSQYNHSTKAYQILQAVWYARLQLFPDEEIIHNFFDDKLELCENSLLIPESCLPTRTTWNAFHRKDWLDSNGSHKIGFKGQVKGPSLSITQFNCKHRDSKEQEQKQELETAVEVFTEPKESLKSKSVLTPSSLSLIQQMSDDSSFSLCSLEEVKTSIMRSKDIFYEPTPEFDPIFNKFRQVYLYFQIRSREKLGGRYDFSARLSHFANYLNKVRKDEPPDLETAENFRITGRVRLFRTQRYYDLWMTLPKTKGQQSASLFIDFLEKNSVNCNMARTMVRELEKINKVKTPSLDMSIGIFT